MEKRGRGTIAFPFHDGSTNPTRTHHKSLSIDTLSFRCLVLLETEARIGGGLMHGMGVVVDGTSAWDPATGAAQSSPRPPACVRRLLRVAACCLLRRRVRVAFIGRGRRTCSLASPRLSRASVVPDSERIRGWRPKRLAVTRSVQMMSTEEHLVFTCL